MMRNNGQRERSLLFETPANKQSNTSGEVQVQILEAQSEKQLDILGDKVAKIKELSRHVHDEAKDSLSLLGRMEGGMNSASSMLKKTFGNFLKMTENSSSNKFMFYIVVFIVCVYLLMTLLWKYL
eukprot:TRINITY_DN5735_c0_g1_i1.p1 TRINITY_DN5735_c0_g1~~TRINITY_DN5735_c0_g1_i1.p1  ORF type:complete len:125 (-),score=21.89 TRINITY_DN5735_c0_g1_i1:98-472(-)